MAFKYYLLFYIRQETLFIGIDEVGQEKKSKGESGVWQSIHNTTTRLRKHLKYQKLEPV